MIRKIIHLADVHIRNFQRHEEYKIILTEFIAQASEIAKEYDYNEVRILIVGDLVHQKNNISNEQNILVSWFLRSCNEIAQTILIAGNHDFNEGNHDRLDSITPVIQMLELPHVKYLDLISGYKSFCYEDDNIVWCLYSIFDEYNVPEVKISKINNPDKIHIGLFHGAIQATSTDSGYMIEHGISMDIFDGCDCVMCGDIHKRTELDYNGIKVVYPSSTIQQNFGENISKHGYLVWDVETLEYDEI